MGISARRLVATAPRPRPGYSAEAADVGFPRGRKYFTSVLLPSSVLARSRDASMMSCALALDV